MNYQLGYQYTESKYRKDYAAFCKLFEANRDKLTDNSAQLHEIEQRELELRKEQRKFYEPASGTDPRSQRKGTRRKPARVYYPLS